MLELIAALAMAGSTPVLNEADPGVVALRVRAYADRHVDEATIRPALEVADELLASAGLVVAWRVCDSAQPCPVEDAPVPEIVVILSSRDRQDGRENCGAAAHGARGSAGTVIVSVPCVAGAAFRLTRRAGTGTNPLLAMPRHDDLVGAIVAHEIGHLLGIRHAPSGLMRARLEAGDMIEFRRGKRPFSPAEARRMRIAALGWKDRRRSSAAGTRVPRQNWVQSGVTVSFAALLGVAPSPRTALPNHANSAVSHQTLLGRSHMPPRSTVANDTVRQGRALTTCAVSSSRLCSQYVTER